MNKKIYLDYAATTPLEPYVFAQMKPYFLKDFGNAFSLHSFGRAAQLGIEKARKITADFLNCQPEEIIFTSGATEANNAVIKNFGSVFFREKIGALPHIIVSQIEHECVLAAAQALEREKKAQVTYLPVNREGLVELMSLEKALKPETVLVSLMYANNEIGTIQPIVALGEFLKKINQTRQNKIYFHTDAVQAVNYLECDVKKLGVDYLTLSAHKFYGPKGVGALFIKSGAPFNRFLDGGEQEFKKRAGTHNCPGIVGLGAALEIVKKEKAKIKKVEILRDKLIKGVLKNIPYTFLNGSQKQRLPNNANFCFEGAEGEALVMALDLAGVAISTGSACASHSLEPSHVLLAIGLEPLQAHSSVRFSLGRFTTEKDIDRVLKLLPPIVANLRNISGRLILKDEKRAKKF